MPRLYMTPTEYQIDVVSPHQSDRLKQSTSLGPFMGELITFAYIAESACQYNIMDCIRGTFSAQWNNMIAMKLIIFNWRLTIIAFAFLPIILVSNLLCRMRAGNMSFKCKPLMSASGDSFPLPPIYGIAFPIGSKVALSVFWTSIVLPRPKTTALFDLRARAALFDMIFVCIVACSFVLPIMFKIFCIELVGVGSDLFSVRFSVGCIKDSATGSTSIVQSTLKRWTFLKEIIGSREDVLTLFALPITFWNIGGALARTALLALRVKSITPVLIALEVLFSGWIRLLTFGATLLRYNSEHVRPPKSCIMSEVVPATLRLKILYLKYTTNPLAKPYYKGVM